MKIQSEQEMLDFGQDFAKKLIAENRLNAVIELIGDVGAGKTTFTRGLALGLGITKPVNSPSFTVSKTYNFKTNHTLTHYDFYRLENPGLMSADLHESIKNGHLIVVEWATAVQDLLPPDRLKITISLNDDGTRTVSKEASSRECGARQREHKRRPPVAFAPWDANRPKGDTGRTDATREEGSLASPTSIYLDTSTPTTILKIDNNTYTHEFGNTLSEKLLQFIHDKLQENHKSWRDIKKIVFMSGPGSFTGLRIGASVVNTLSHELNIPLYDHHGHQHQIILPDYGREANISTPKK